MKKVLALVLSLVMLLAVGCAGAEATSFEDIYEGAWVQFEDGFELYLPAEWLQIEVTDEMLANGIFYVAASPDGAYTFQIAWAALDAELSVEELEQQLASAYPGAKLMDMGTHALVCYADAANNILGFAGLDATEPGMYMFCFTPMADENLQALASVIVASLRMI